MPTSSYTCTLKENDVVSGRGGLANNHPGNRLFRRLVAENKHNYQSLTEPSHKQLLVVSIVKAIRKSGGRFVRRESESSDSWIEISEEKAICKTAQALREADKPKPDPITPLSPPSSNFLRKTSVNGRTTSIPLQHTQSISSSSVIPVIQSPPNNDIVSTSSECVTSMPPMPLPIVHRQDSGDVVLMAEFLKDLLTTRDSSYKG